MRIGIDARWIFDQPSGIGIYTRELIRALAESDSSNDYVLFFNDHALEARTAEETGFLSNPRFTTQRLNYGLFSLRGQLLLPGLFRRLNLDVFHSTNYMIPLLAFPSSRNGGTAAVVTIHDAIPLKFPDHAPRSRKARFFFIFKRVMREVGQRADMILTVSATSRADLITHLHLSSDAASRVEAIYNGVSPRFTPPPFSSTPRDPRRVRQLLYVGRADPYKNLEMLIQAFAELQRNAPFPVRLRLAGALDPRYPQAPELARDLGINESIDWIEKLSPDELVRTYREADVLVMPSRYEGFGLPVAEAMACGTPVVCGRCGALEEVGGDAVLFADPNNAHDITQQLQRVLSDAALAAELSRKGPIRAARFNWRLTAAATLKAYSKAIAIRRGENPL